MPERIRVTHPFHPLHGCAFELLAYRHNWGEDRVVVVAADGRVRSMPAAWTDVGERDPFVALSAGRAPFRTEDLLALVALVRGLTDAAERRPTGGA